MYLSGLLLEKGKKEEEQKNFNVKIEVAQYSLGKYEEFLNKITADKLTITKDLKQDISEIMEKPANYLITKKVNEVEKMLDLAIDNCSGSYKKIEEIKVEFDKKFTRNTNNKKVMSKLDIDSLTQNLSLALKNYDTYLERLSQNADVLNILKELYVDVATDKEAANSRFTNITSKITKTKEARKTLDESFKIKEISILKYEMIKKLEELRINQKEKDEAMAKLNEPDKISDANKKYDGIQSKINRIQQEDSNLTKSKINEITDKQYNDIIAKIDEIKFYKDEFEQSIGICKTPNSAHQDKHVLNYMSLRVKQLEDLFKEVKVQAAAKKLVPKGGNGTAGNVDIKDAMANTPQAIAARKQKEVDALEDAKKATIAKFTEEDKIAHDLGIDLDTHDYTALAVASSLKEIELLGGIIISAGD